MIPAVEKKRAAFLEHKRSPCENTKRALRAARAEVQRTARRCANDYWLNLCNKIWIHASFGHLREMYDGIKQAIGPRQNKTAPLKSKSGDIITDKTKQMGRWLEYFSEPYDLESTVSDTALEAIEQLPLMSELDDLPTVEELKNAINHLVAGKAPGQDGILPEVIKCARDTLLQPPHELLCQCWEEGVVPQDMRDATIVTLYKNKGERSDCNNYRGISLLSVTGKLFAEVVLRRLQKIAQQIYPESQCGFRAGRSTVDMIFSLRQLQKKCREQRKPLYVAFIDLTKAFDTVSRSGLFRVLGKIGYPPKLLKLIQSFHADMQGTVRFNGSTSDAFSIKSGVKQGCVLAPTLFGIFFAVLLKQAFGNSTEGVYLRTRCDGKLFNLARLKARSKVRKVFIRDMLFADDAALVSHTEEELQRLMDCFSRTVGAFGLKISLEKTNVMGQSTPQPPSISIGNYTLEVVHAFDYLGSTITDTMSLEPELNKRIGKAATTLSSLSRRVWTNGMLSKRTKIKVYCACVLGVLLYGSETWILYARQEKRLNTFHLRCLRRILQISWKDKVTNGDVLNQAGLPSMQTILRLRRLRWLGHVRRMDDGRIPKDILYGELDFGVRPTGRPHLRFKDVCKKDLRELDINVNGWEELATARCSWRQELHQGLGRGKQKLRLQAEERRRRRKVRLQVEHMNGTQHICCNCGKDCHSRLGLHSHGRRCKPP
uniref:Reverse transcriptase domain-containing protein n=1 Tax=Scleropages formosus TaxID=113540 RepID=A0A8C9WDN1_SCLFO